MKDGQRNGGRSGSSERGGEGGEGGRSPGRGARSSRPPRLGRGSAPSRRRRAVFVVLLRCAQAPRGGVRVAEGGRLPPGLIPRQLSSQLQCSASCRRRSPRAHKRASVISVGFCVEKPAGVSQADTCTGRAKTGAVLVPGWDRAGVLPGERLSVLQRMSLRGDSSSLSSLLPAQDHLSCQYFH